MTPREYKALGHRVTTDEEAARFSAFSAQRRGNLHPRYIGGHINKRTGYRDIWVNGKLTLEHRHVMSEHLGRALRSDEVVHHLDGNPINNDISNLQLMNQSDHIALHQELGQTQYGKRFTKPPIAKPRAVDMDHLLTLHRAGHTDAEITVLMGISRDTIRRRLRDAGIVRRAGNHHQLDLTVP